MSRQGVLFRAFILASNNNRVIFNNRINYANFQIQPSLTMGLKQFTARPNLKGISFPERPKKPIGAYFKFVQDHREQIMRENLNLSQPEVTKKCAEMWANLSEAEKRRYLDSFHTEYEDFKVKWAKYEKQLTPEQREALHITAREKAKSREKRLVNKINKETNKPKKPVSPHVRYLEEERKKNNMSLKDIMQELKGKYATLPEEERKRFTEEFEKDKVQYLQQLEQWKIRVIRLGHADTLKIKHEGYEKPSKASRRDHTADEFYDYDDEELEYEKTFKQTPTKKTVKSSTHKKPGDKDGDQ